MKVFLGGTVSNSKWRDYLIPQLKIEYFDPNVKEWTPEAQKQEIKERKNADFCLYVISPKMQGWYSLAEVTDDSYKKSDKTIFCFLKEDDKVEFTEEQIKELERLGKLIRSNGAIWKESLDDVIDFLNSANELSNDELLKQSTQINSAFISYGRRHSMAFARKLYQNLSKNGYHLWFDMNDIPLGVDFQEQIDDGIRKADNFIYIMSPHSINSVYCYKELVLALKYNKRIIPILNIEPQDDATWNKIDPEIGKRNWIYMRQEHNTGIELSAAAMKIKEEVLAISEEKWGHIDDFNVGLKNLMNLIDSQRAYVRTHTILLDNSLDWIKDSRNPHKLLVGKKRWEAELFLERSHQSFKNQTGHLIQAPCQPTNLIAEYIMESKKNAHNMQSDLFICHDVNDADKVKKISSRLSKYGFSSWISSRDISKGVEYNHAIHNGVVQSANMLLFITEKSLQSDYCKKEYQFAQKYNKRIIPILLESKPQGYKNPVGFPGLQDIQYIDFTDLTDEVIIKIKNYKDVKAEVEARREKSPFENSIDELINSLNFERPYYEEHRILLSQALYWKEQGKKLSFLLRGFNLENAHIWLRLSKERKENPPLALHEEFILAGEAAKGQLGTDVFLSYSRKDGDWARKLNRELQIAGKTTWFDQESISKGADFEKEIFKGIDGCNNFVFVISPDAVISEYCESEVNYAVSQNKRIITLLIRKTEPKIISEALKKINWIDFTERNFLENFGDLIQAIELDRQHAATHTLLQQRANEWNEQQQSPDFLLNATACQNAEKWLMEAFERDIKTIYLSFLDLKCKKTPIVTNLQLEYIKISRQKIDAANAQEQKKRKRLQIVVITASIAAIIAIGLFIYAQKQTKIANKKTIEAQENFNLAKKKTLELSAKQNELEVALKQAKKAKNLAEQKRIEAEIERNKAEQLASGSMKLLKHSLPMGEKDVFAFYFKKAKSAFIAGKYDRAIESYQGAKLLPKGMKEATKIELKIQKAKTCIKLYNRSNPLLLSFNFKPLIRIYRQILRINKQDPRALWRMESLKKSTTLAFLQSANLRLIKAGTFAMGGNSKADEKPIHKVMLDNFKISAYTITNKQFALFLNQYKSLTVKSGEYKGHKLMDVGDNHLTKNNNIWEADSGYQKYPVVYVTWFGANEFCRFYGLELPSEAQWEKAAHTSSGIYAGSTNIDEVAWYEDNSEGLQIVGQLKPNQWGLYDMSGNVWEWCNDWYSSGYYSQSPEKNPRGPESGTGRIKRGGAWNSFDFGCRSTARQKENPNFTSFDLGFRVVLAK